MKIESESIEGLSLGIFPEELWKIMAGSYLKFALPLSQTSRALYNIVFNNQVWEILFKKDFSFYPVQSENRSNLYLDRYKHAHRTLLEKPPSPFETLKDVYFHRLQIAVSGGYEQVVKELTLPYRDGWTAFFYANPEGHNPVIMELLVKAIKSGNPETLKILTGLFPAIKIKEYILHDDLFLIRKAIKYENVPALKNLVDFFNKEQQVLLITDNLRIPDLAICTYNVEIIDFLLNLTEAQCRHERFLSSPLIGMITALHVDRTKIEDLSEYFDKSGKAISFLWDRLSLQSDHRTFAQLLSPLHFDLETRHLLADINASADWVTTLHVLMFTFFIGKVPALQGFHEYDVQQSLTRALYIALSMPLGVSASHLAERKILETIKNLLDALGPKLAEKQLLILMDDMSLTFVEKADSFKGLIRYCHINTMVKNFSEDDHTDMLARICFVALYLNHPSLPEVIKKILASNQDSNTHDKMMYFLRRTLLYISCSDKLGRARDLSLHFPEEIWVEALGSYMHSPLELPQLVIEYEVERIMLDAFSEDQYQRFNRMLLMVNEKFWLTVVKVLAKVIRDDKLSEAQQALTEFVKSSSNPFPRILAFCLQHPYGAAVITSILQVMPEERVADDVALTVFDESVCGEERELLFRRLSRDQFIASVTDVLDKIIVWNKKPTDSYMTQFSYVPALVKYTKYLELLQEIFNFTPDKETKESILKNGLIRVIEKSDQNDLAALIALFKDLYQPLINVIGAVFYYFSKKWDLASVKMLSALLHIDDQFRATCHALHLAIENDQPETVTVLLGAMQDKEKAYKALTTVFNKYYTGRPAEFLDSLPSKHRVKMAAMVLKKYYHDEDESIGSHFNRVLSDRFSTVERLEVMQKYLHSAGVTELIDFSRFVLLCGPLHLSLVICLLAEIDQHLSDNKHQEADEIKEATKHFLLHEIDLSVVAEILVNYLDTNQLRFKVLSLIPDALFDRVLHLALFKAVKESGRDEPAVLLNLLPAKKRLHIVLERDDCHKTLFHYAAKRRDAKMVFESVISTLPVHLDALEISADGVDQFVLALTEASQPSSRSQPNELPRFGSFLSALGLSSLTGVAIKKESKSPEETKGQMDRNSK